MSWLTAAAIGLAWQAATAEERNEELGRAIAAQGNAALVEIRRDATRIPLPPLPPFETAVPEGGVARAGDAETPDLVEVRARARLLSLRRDVYFDPAAAAPGTDARH